jgi:hypothetical protein
MLRQRSLLDPVIPWPNVIDFEVLAIGHRAQVAFDIMGEWP